MKKLFLVLIVMIIGISMVSAQGQKDASSASEADEKIVVWSFTDEIKTMAEYFTAEYPNVEVEVVVIPNADEVYFTRVNTALRSGSQVPDVFTGERAYFRQFIDSGFYLPVSDAPYYAEELMKDAVPYVPELSRTADGSIAALSWQATPGGLYYRRSIAKEVLGTDDPAEVSKWTSDLNKFYELGEMIRDTYNGQKYLLAGGSDMLAFAWDQRTKPYIQGNNLVIPQSLVDYMLLNKKMRDNGLTAGIRTWDPAWFASMGDGSVFAFLLPTWGLHFVLKGAAEPGDWGLAEPPAAYSWGGTWIGVNRNSRNKDLAWEFVKFIGASETFQEAWARDTGDFVSNLKVVERIKDDFAEPFLAGQNHYDFFYEIAKQVDVSYVGPWDLQIQNAWDDEVERFSTGQKSYENAIRDFKIAVRDFLPNINDIIIGE